MDNQNFYFSTLIGNRLNVVQQYGQGGESFARYYVVDPDKPTATSARMITHGWIERDDDGIVWFTDGEDYTDITSWDKFDGTLIPL